MIKVAHIDDCSNFRYLFNERIKSYNSLTMGDKISLSQYKSGEDFFNAKGEFDLVIIDINMHKDSGPDVARVILRSLAPPLIMFCSDMVDKYETLISIIPKFDYKISELMSRYHELKGDVCDRNRFDIQSRIDTYA